MSTAVERGSVDLKAIGELRSKTGLKIIIIIILRLKYTKILYQ